MSLRNAEVLKQDSFGESGVRGLVGNWQILGRLLEMKEMEEAKVRPPVLCRPRFSLKRTL